MKSIYRILTSNNPNLTFLQILILIGIVLFGIVIYKASSPPKKYRVEGFTQKQPFVLKTNEAVYDDFYIDIYDELYDTKQRGKKELVQILKTTEPTVKNSSFLDIGSGTGYIVNQLSEAGYIAYGIDKSQAMVEYSDKKYAKSEYKCGDAVDPMTFDNSSFTHILCTNFTIYSFEDKERFFRNCYFWMVPGGYLVVHLVDYDNFNIYAPRTKASMANFPSLTKKPRVTNTIADFYDYKYNASYRFPQQKNSSGVNEVVFQEEFIDKTTNNVRQNEQTMYMMDIDKIVAIANKVGFVLHAKMNMKNIFKTNVGEPANPYADENQYLYVFERTM